MDEKPDDQTLPKPPVYDLKGDIPGVSEGRALFFNAGHAIEVEKGRQDLAGEKGILLRKLQFGKSESGFLAVSTETIIEYLQKHQEDDPHAIDVLLAIVVEELDQEIPPKRALNAYADALKMEDVPDEFPELGLEPFTSKDKLELEEKELADSLTLIPGQIIAVNRLVSDPKLVQFVEEYSQRYATEVRIDHGEPTGDTYPEYLSKVLEKIKQILATRTSEMIEVLEDIPFLQEHGVLPATYVSTVEQIKGQPKVQ